MGERWFFANWPCRNHAEALRLVVLTVEEQVQGRKKWETYESHWAELTQAKVSSLMSLKQNWISGN